MSTFPIQCNRTYVNSGGNLSASGYYRSSATQKLANMFPQWMHLRKNPRSIAQQFMSPLAMELDKLEHTMDDSFKSKFIATAPVSEIDVLYRMKLPSNIDLTNASASGVRCITAPSGVSPSGADSIWVNDVDSLEAFYYHKLPTRLEVVASGILTSAIDGTAWHTKPSGVLDLNQKHIDYWKIEHDISWAYTNSYFKKQDVETMGDYEVYEQTGQGTLTDMYFYDNLLWWIGINEGDYLLHIANPKTKVPQATSLDLLATFDITDAFLDHEPSGIIIDEEGTIWVQDTRKTMVYELKPRYDYFILDKENRYVYFREDYRDSKVFMSNT